jgi:hypothetical protein
MNTTISDFFAREEVSRLEAGLPRLQEWSNCMLVPFQARQLRFASTIWINPRWFLERGININDDLVRKRVSDWLLGDFGYAIPKQDDPKDAFSPKVRTLHADRYGGSTGRSVHGGSGRVATVGCYQAKGIGVTPLAGVGANWVHSHGCASVEESVREAIFAEVADAEFPFGAVPVVAILDAGLHFSSPAQAGANSSRMRRAIIVRPAVLRLAHVERAPLFVQSLTGYSNSQLDDVRRTKDVIHRWLTQDSEHCTAISVPSLTELARRIAEQVAFGQVHRLFNGGYFSSNLSATGALLDFGGMRALPNWANAKNLDHAVGFGDEMEIVTKVIRSLAFYFNKYRAESTPPVQEAELLSQSQQAYTRGFTAECLRMWNVAASADTAVTTAIAQSVRRYFMQQQKLRVNYKHGLVAVQEWLYNDVADGARSVSRDSSIEMQTLSAVQLALKAQFATLPNPHKQLLRAWSSATRYLMPRFALDREQLQQRINRALSAKGTQSKCLSSLVGEIIRTTVSLGRRHWPRSPGDLRVQAHVAYEGSSALQCIELRNDQPALWLEGIRSKGIFWLFGSSFTAEDARDLGVRCDGTYWTALIPMSRGDVDSRSEYALTLQSCSIQIPPMQVVYAQPHTWLTDVGPDLPIAETG